MSDTQPTLALSAFDLETLRFLANREYPWSPGTEGDRLSAIKLWARSLLSAFGGGYLITDAGRVVLAHAVERDALAERCQRAEAERDRLREAAQLALVALGAKSISDPYNITQMEGIKFQVILHLKAALDGTREPTS